MMTAKTSKYAVVIHWTVAVLTSNSSMSAGNVTFMTVSTTTPENDMMPVATTDMMSRASSTRSNSPAAIGGCSVTCMLYSRDCDARAGMSLVRADMRMIVGFRKRCR